MRDGEMPRKKKAFVLQVQPFGDREFGPPAACCLLLAQCFSLRTQRFSLRHSTFVMRSQGTPGAWVQAYEQRSLTNLGC